MRIAWSTPARRGLPFSTAALAVAATAAAIAVAAAILAGCGRRETVQTSTTAASKRAVGAFQIAVENRPSRPVVGDNRLVIVVEDSSGKPVAGAQVQMLAVMPAMGTMPRMESRGTIREDRPGVYEARYGLSMQGEWDIELAIRAPDGKEAVATYRLSTSTSELSFVGGTLPPAAAGSGPAPTTAGAAGPLPPGLGEVILDPARRQSIGIRTIVAAPRPLRADIRAAGKVAYDETRRTEVSPKFSGWIREVFVDYTGKVVQRGEPLVSVYSPELLSAQQEYLEALRAAGRGSAGAPSSDADLAEAARQRLRLWDITPQQIDAIRRAGRPLEAVPIGAPGSGVVVEKNVVRGSSFMAGQPLYRIAPINPVWVVASVYQYELPLVRAGMTAVVETPSLPEQRRAGRVSYINPYLDPVTRTGEVRLTVANPRGDLKPGMFVDVILERDLGSRLAVPAGAVLFEGDRRVVFVDAGGGRLLPREIELGPKAGDWYAVERGLLPGEVVVTSGNFLIAAESKLRAATRRP